MNKIVLALLIAFSCSSSFAKKESGTGVNNGGDPLLTYLNTLRDALVVSTEAIAAHPDSTLCARIASENAKYLCQDLLKEAVPQINSLAKDLQISFVLRTDPLFVKGPDGSFMPVAARTNLGNTGSIEFHRGSINTMSPKELLFLMTHEFQHKIFYKGKYISDDEIISGVQGRSLIDSVATAVSDYALNKGFIGAKLNITDIFDCAVSTPSTEFGSLIRADRMMNGASLAEYQISVGNNPYDASFYIKVGHAVKVNFKFVISELSSCTNPVPELHKTKMEITRSTVQSDGTLNEEILTTKEEYHNPTCANETSFFGASYKDISFRCKYLGSAAATK